jgi:hypothetical protein
LTAALLALACGVVFADVAPPAARPELVWELSAYYTDVDLYIPLTARPMPESHGDREWQIYRDLFLQSLRPQLLLFEASVYPLPVAGQWVRRRHPSFYRDAKVGSVNWIESVTAGFQEPAAVSAFIGSAMAFERPGQAHKATNKGHMGYLVSFGTEHIAHNVLLHEPWYELEWKLKGDKSFRGDRLTWSFRVGTRQHSDPDIADTVYVGLKRNHLDFGAPLLGWLNNTDAEGTLAAASRGLMSAQLFFGKNYPLRGMGLAMNLQMGVIYENDLVYSGRLRQTRDNVLFVLRPNITF